MRVHTLWETMLVHLVFLLHLRSIKTFFQHQRECSSWVYIEKWKSPGKAWHQKNCPSNKLMNKKTWQTPYVRTTWRTCTEFPLSYTSTIRWSAIATAQILVGRYLGYYSNSVMEKFSQAQSLLRHMAFFKQRATTSKL